MSAGQSFMCQWCDQVVAPGNTRVRVGDLIAENERLRAENARLLAALKAAEATDWAIRELFELPKDGDLFERIGDWEQDRVVGEVRLQNAVHNVLAEILYENRRKEDGIAVHFLMRLSMLACEARLEGWEKDKPIVAEAIRTLGDPGQANIKEESDTASAALTGAPDEHK